MTEFSVLTWPPQCHVHETSVKLVMIAIIIIISEIVGLCGAIILVARFKNGG